MRNQRVVAVLGVFAAGAMVAGANAQVTPVGPFTGDQSEGFEDGNQTVFKECLDVGSGRGFNDTADICTLNGAGILETTGWSFRCTIFPHGGSWFMGSAGGFVTVTFDNPVTEFGGYFGSNAFQSNETANAIANFYDDSGNLIDSVDMDITNSCTWTWNGWKTQGAAIKSVELINGVFGGAFLDMDDLEYLAGSSDCLTMTVDPLIAGQTANWNISGATPNSKGVVVYGFQAGSTAVNGTGGFCATFGIKGVNQNKVVGFWGADGSGNASVSKKIPSFAQGKTVLTQAAERDTCPDECVSGVDTQVVQ